MLKNIKWKNITEFLKKEYPENLQPIRKIPKKHYKIIKEKKEIFKKIKKRIKKIEKNEIENLIVIKKKNYNSENENSWILFNNTFFLNQQNWGKREKETGMVDNRIGTTPLSTLLVLPEIHPMPPLRKGSLKTKQPPQLKKDNKKKNYKILLSYEQINSKVLKKRIQYKKVSEFLMKLKEKKKINILYGNISKNFFEKASRQSLRSTGKINENLLFQFELRLDVLLYRICFCKTIYGAKQAITHNFVTINGKIVNIPSYQVKTGDIISINRYNYNQFGNRLLKDFKIYLSTRQFRSLISYKYLQKYIKKSDDFHKTINLLKTRLNSLNLLINSSKKNQKKQNSNPYHQPERRPEIRPYSPKSVFLKAKQKWSTRQQGLNKNSQKFQLLKKIKYLNQLVGTINSNAKFKPFLKPHNQYLKKKILLKIKYYMRLQRSQQNRLNAMRISPLKPLHVEISYKLLTAVVLYSPQKLAFPTLLNIDLFVRSLV